MIFSSEVIDKIYSNTKSMIENSIVRKEDLIEEIKMFEITISQVKQHPWHGISVNQVERDQESALYQNIQTSYVGDDPEEDYKEVIVWEIANMLYVTAAIDHDPKIFVKWDVVVFNSNKENN